MSSPAKVSFASTFPRLPGCDELERLSAIAAMQHHVASISLDLQSAVSVIIQRTQELTNAAAVAVGLVDGNDLVYRYSSGNEDRRSGLRVRADSSLSAECLRTGEIVECADLQTRSPFELASCHRLGTRSCIIVPLQQHAKIIGTMEVLADDAHAFRKLDVYTAELSAGLLSSVIISAAEVESEEAIAAERAAMLQAIEKITCCLQHVLKGQEAGSSSEEQSTTSTQANATEDLGPCFSEQIRTLSQAAQSAQAANLTADSDIKGFESGTGHQNSTGHTNDETAQSMVADDAHFPAEDPTLGNNDLLQQLQDGMPAARKRATAPDPLPADSVQPAGIAEGGTLEVLANQPLQLNRPKCQDWKPSAWVPQNASAVAATSVLDHTVKPASGRGLPKGTLLGVTAVLGVLLAILFWHYPTVKKNRQGSNRVENNSKVVAFGADATQKRVAPIIPASALGWSKTMNAAASSPAPADTFSVGAEVTGIRYWTAPDYIAVAIVLSREVTYDQHRLSDPERIFFNLRDTQPDLLLEGRTFEVNDALLRHIRLAKHGKDTRVTMQFNSRAEYTVTTSPNHSVLVIQVRLRPDRDRQFGL